MGGERSGTSVSREVTLQALKAVAGGMSLREAARHYGVDRGTLASYRDGEGLFRRLIRRCPECGSIVRMPCIACSPEVQQVANARRKKRLVKARRKK
jgi:transposase-like protein